jgi:hypothetical protein
LPINTWAKYHAHSKAVYSTPNRRIKLPLRHREKRESTKKF